MNINSINKINIKNKIKNNYISQSINNKFNLTNNKINSFKKTLILSSINSLNKLILNNPLSILFTSTIQKNNNQTKINIKFNS